MRTIPAPELALWKEADASETSVRELRVRVKRPGDAAFTNLSAILGGDWVLGVRSEGDTPDQPAGRFTVQFIKRTTEGSISPGISASSLNIDAALAFRPILHPGRSIEVDVRIDAEPWRLWLQGRIKEVDWAGAEAVASCLTLDGVILATQIEVEEPRGAPDPGTAVETEIQGLLTRWMATAPTLLTVGSPGWGVGQYTPPLGSLGEQIRLLAQRNAWDVRYRWSEADSNFRLTLFLPNRDATVAVFQLSTALMQEVASLRISDEWVRNAIIVHYANSAGVLQTPVEVTDAASITEYGRLAMPIRELSADSPIKSSTAATNLATAAKKDLSVPLADGRWRIPFSFFLELHDLLGLQADGDHYDFDTDFAIVGISHVVEPEGGWWTEVELRGGKPAGAFYSWHARAEGTAGADDPEGQIIDRKVGRTAEVVTLSGTPGRLVSQVYAYEALVSEPFLPSAWPATTGAPLAIYSAATFAASGHAVPIPSENKVRLVVLVTKDAAGASLWEWRYAVYPTTPDPTIVDVAVTGQMVQVVGGPGVQSIRMAHRGGTWVAFYDGQGLTIDVSKADAAGVAGIGSAATWTVDVYAYGVPKTEVVIGTTPSATRATTVYGSGVSGGSQPQWEVILGTAPADLSDVLTIRLRAANITAETAKLYAKWNTGTGWSAETDITAAVSPALSTAPSVNTDYTWTSSHTRDDSHPRPVTVTYHIRAELLSGATVVDNDWDEVSFTTGT